MTKMKWNKRVGYQEPNYESDRLERAADKLLYTAPKKDRKMRRKLKRKPVVKLASTDIRRTGPRVVMPEGLTLDDLLK